MEGWVRSYYLMGKSSSGKDTLYKELKKRFPGLRQVILYTTRPVRDGERDGVEYHFVPAETAGAFRRGRQADRAADVSYGVRGLEIRYCGRRTDPALGRRTI